MTKARWADYGGISGSRLEVLEERLRDDVRAELEEFGGKLLLHTESSDGSVVPVWQDVHPEDVAVLRDIMSARKNQGDVILQYNRVAITAEKSPDFTDLNDLMEIVLRSGANTPIVVNCQLGRGRSTLASVLLVLIRQWFQWHVPMTPMTSRPLQRSMSMLSASAAGEFKLSKARHSYTVINSESPCPRCSISVVTPDALFRSPPSPAPWPCHKDGRRRSYRSMLCSLQHARRH
jgi:hypothetical protein